MSHWNDLLSPRNGIYSCQAALETLKQVLAKQLILAYPDFDMLFEIYTNTLKLQLGAMMSQDSQQAFYGITNSLHCHRARNLVDRGNSSRIPVHPTGTQDQ